MAIKVAINGFGRIGRLTLRALLESKRTDIEVVAINDLGSSKLNASLLQNDSIHGRLASIVSYDDKGIIVDGKHISVYSERDPTNLPWGTLGIDIVFECTGLFTARNDAAKHIQAGSKKVLISGPSGDADLTVVYGINHDKITADHKVISNASCTTNCLAPVADTLNNGIGIQHGYMTTIHSYTGDQKILDAYHKDVRRARAAAQSMIPTTTGAAKAVGLVLPELKGKLDGCSIRVPTPNVSVVDLTFVAKRATTVEEVHSLIKAASQGKLKGVLEYTEDELVSVDFNHNSHSSIFDATQTNIIDGTLVRVVSWYDNEWGFSNRMLDTAVAFAKV